MARGKAISVKIATTKVIKALESALAKLESDYAGQEASEAKYKKSLEKWEKDVQKLVMASVKSIEDFSASLNYRNEVRVNFSIPAGTIELPKQPEREVQVMQEWNYREQKEEISNAIRILKMTDEEVVSTSTYNAVARYL
jgi:hypothetical protein